MLRYSLLVTACLTCAGPALADELPTRKAGLWDITMHFEGTNLPAHSLQQCTDESTDKLMMSSFGSAGEKSCPDRHIVNSGSTITMDSVCQFGPTKVTSHALIKGDFNSAYTIEVTSRREGGPALPHVAPGGVTHMMMSAKWLGPCAKGQVAGDIIMPGGIKMNIRKLTINPGGAPPRP